MKSWADTPSDTEASAYSARHCGISGWADTAFGWARHCGADSSRRLCLGTYSWDAVPCRHPARRLDGLHTPIVQAWLVASVGTCCSLPDTSA